MGIVTSSAGCAYHVGTSTLYRPDIQTVHVPIFQSDSLRPELGERLTEAVAREIEQSTSYKVVDDVHADSVIHGKIEHEYKRPLAEDRNDEPRDLELGFLVQTEWRDRSGNLLGRNASLPFADSVITHGQTVHLIPEAGPSAVTQQQLAIERLARQIVAQMEMPW